MRFPNWHDPPSRSRSTISSMLHTTNRQVGSVCCALNARLLAHNIMPTSVPRGKGRLDRHSVCFTLAVNRETFGVLPPRDSVRPWSRLASLDRSTVLNGAFVKGHPRNDARVEDAQPGRCFKMDRLADVVMSLQGRLFDAALLKARDGPANQARQYQAQCTRGEGVCNGLGIHRAFPMTRDCSG
jgi:hypothetical protein